MDPAGFVCLDANRDGDRDSGETGLGAVQMIRRTVAEAGYELRQQVVTNGLGVYQFAFLPAETYSLWQFQSVGYVSGQPTVGSHGGTVGVKSI